MNGKLRVFVTDGSYSNGLAAVRSLSRAGHRVTVGERASISRLATMCFWSRHCAERFRYPDPRRETEACAATLADHFTRNRYEAAIPVGLDMVELFVRFRDSLPVPVMLPPAESFRIASYKRLTFEHALSLGMPAPRTLPGRRWNELEAPVVFKHSRRGALIAYTPEVAAGQAKKLGPCLEEYIAQEYIPGRNGFGYFGFFQSGRETGYFMHQRLLQYPKDGGPSVVARSIHNDRLRDLGRSLLESLSWHGPAMVEFKRSERDGEFYLIEINPKLWGSLDLAIQAGCDFPVWIARAAMTGEAPPANHYREGLTYQFVLPDGPKFLLHYPELRGRFLRNLVAPKVRTDLSWLDPLPAAATILAPAANLRRTRSAIAALKKA